jgi:hypothetical protein
MGEINYFKLYVLDNDVIDDIEEMSLIVDMSCVDWMMS